MMEVTDAGETARNALLPDLEEDATLEIERLSLVDPHPENHDQRKSLAPQSTVYPTNPPDGETENQKQANPGECKNAACAEGGTKGQTCNALIVCKIKEDGSKEFEDEEVRQYEEYLDATGFNIAREDSKMEIRDLKDAIEKNIEGSDYFIAIVFRKSGQEGDLADLVESIKGVNNTAVKLLILCRIGEHAMSIPDTTERTDYFSMNLENSRKTLRNLIVMRCTVQAHELAVNFIHKLKLLKEGNWKKREGLQSIIPAQFSDEEFSQYKIEANCNGMLRSFAPPQRSDKLLMHSTYFRKIIGGVSHREGIAEEVVEFLRKSEDKISDILYPNEVKHQRKALVINNARFERKELSRDGSQMDVANLTHALEFLRYKVTVKSDLTAADIKKAVDDFANNEIHGDSCVLVIMSHGNLGGIFGTDYRDGEKMGLAEYSELLKLMREGVNIKTKPRLVLFQACRVQERSKEQNKSKYQARDSVAVGAALAVGQHYGAPRMTDSELPPDQCGIIVGYSTSPGDFSLRSTCSGTRFILAVCAAFYEYADKEDMLSMITRINFIMVNGFGLYSTRDGKRKPQQLPHWEVQTHKKFFLVDTSELTSEPKQPGFSGLSTEAQ